MAKFYLHMQPGETLGKVTKLKYIDDISDDELTIYVFEDKSKCDESYVAEMNSMEAFNGRFVMTELSDPTNKWEFMIHEVNLDKGRTVVGADGVTYELPDAGIGRNGEHISLSFTDDGTPIAKSLSTNGKRTDATPPRIAKNKKVEPKENYLLSLHPELIDSSLASSTHVVNEQQDIMSHTINIGKKQTTPVTDNIVTTPVSTQAIKQIPNNNQKPYTSPISTNIIETVKHASININVDDILSNSDFDSVSLIIDGKTENITVSEFVNRLKQVYVNKQELSPYEDPDYKEDILITNMIDKSKKKVYTIGVDVEMELPPREVYETIKNVYPDGMSQNFVTSIARRMNNNTLKESLAAGLTSYYETSLKNNDVVESE